MLGKKRRRENPRAPEGAAAAGQNEENKGANGGCDEQIAARKGGVATPAPEKAHSMPRSHRELGEAILAVADPVNVGCELLDKKANRGAAARLRALETFADWAYGKPATEGTGGRVRIIWDIPLPSSRANSSEPERLEGGDR